MIAVCPSCHDAIHYGKLRISDEDLYTWKNLSRPKRPDVAHVSVDPAGKLDLVLGSISLSSANSEQMIFSLANGSFLKIRLLDREWLQVSTRLMSTAGVEVLRVIENNVRVNRAEGVDFDFRPGMARIEVPNTVDYLPRWVIEQVRHRYTTFGANERLTALEIKVVGPGRVSLQGFWASPEGVVVAYRDGLNFCSPSRELPSTLLGEGALIYAGDPRLPMFAFE
jgi:hypothetical protein